MKKVNSNFVEQTPKKYKNEAGEEVFNFTQLYDPIIFKMGLLSGNAFKLFVYLRRWSQDKDREKYLADESSKGYLTIEQETGIGNVRNCIIELAENGLLFVKFGKKRKDGTNEANHYFVRNEPKIDPENIALIKSRSYSKKNDETDESRFLRKYAKEKDPIKKQALLQAMMDKQIAKAESTPVDDIDWQEKMEIKEAKEERKKKKEEKKMNTELPVEDSTVTVTEQLWGEPCPIMGENTWNEEYENARNY